MMLRTRDSVARAAPVPLRPAAGQPLVPAVSRALALLERLADLREPMSLTRLASDLALPKSSVHGLCSTLVSLGYLRRQSDGDFFIGPRVMGLAEAFVSGTDVAQEFNALWADRRKAPEETIVLSVLSGSEALYVAVRNSDRPLDLAFNVGMRLPAHLSAGGKAMLAHLPADDVARRLAGNVRVCLTPNGPHSLEALNRELALTRCRGYSIDDEGVREGVYSFGAPVFDAAGSVAAAISVCINKALLGTDRGARPRDAVLEVACTLSARLGGSAALPPGVR